MELIVLVTELTIRPQTAGFIARYGCEGYYRNNQKLQFSERSRELQREAARVLTEDTGVPPSSFGVPEEDPDSSAADNTKCFFP